MYRHKRQGRCGCSNGGGRILCLALLCSCAAVLTVWSLYDGSVSLGEGESEDLEKYEPFETELREDFPQDGDSKIRIPKIIHQTWKNLSVPPEFQDNIRSFVTHNPSFMYYYWTDDSARMLIKEKHPHLLETFDNYVEKVRRADMIRYVVLYEFGGVYADLDTECLRPLDRVLTKYACVVSPEPYEHASLIYNAELIVTNSIMFCKAQHPFIRNLLQNLPTFSHFSQDIDASGPNYMTLFYNKYKKDVLDARKLDISDNEFLYLSSSQYFQNTIDPVRNDQFRRTCKRFTSLNMIQKRGCVALKRHGMTRKDTKFTYTKHSFYHTGYKLVKDSDRLITDIVPHVKMYDAKKLLGDF